MNISIRHIMFILLAGAAIGAQAEDADSLAAAEGQMAAVAMTAVASLAGEADAPSIEMPDYADGTTVQAVDSLLPTDSVIEMRKKQSRDYWKEQLMKGKLNIYDESIQYPSFLQFCVDVYRWGDRVFNSYDPDYVVGTGYKFKTFIKNEEWLESYMMRFPDKTSVAMATNISVNMGAYVSYMAVSLGYSQELNSFLGNANKGQTKLAFQFNCSRFAAEFYYYKNSGGTNIHRLGQYKDGHWFSEQFPGLSMESYGVDVYYFFNNKKYSHGAAYSYSKIQKRSAGSMIAGVTISHQNVGIDFNSLSDILKTQLPEDRMTYRFKYNDYCFLLGYGYNWVFHNNWLFNVSVLPSIGFKHCFADNIDGGGNIFSVNFKGKLGLVRNTKRFFYGMGFHVDGHWYRSENYWLTNTIWSLTLTAGFRFNLF